MPGNRVCIVCTYFCPVEPIDVVLLFIPFDGCCCCCIVGAAAAGFPPAGLIGELPPLVAAVTALTVWPLVAASRVASQSGASENGLMSMRRFRHGSVAVATETL